MITFRSPNTRRGLRNLGQRCEYFGKKPATRKKMRNAYCAHTRCVYSPGMLTQQNNDSQGATAEKIAQINLVGIKK
jgi:hypothetical protein